ncbi:MAG: hypothetical protein ACJAT7_002505 [Psychromonas sp.]|uniref:hypothetical protein n=1 Tax=Psychromonas sp. TaxID=1884585 RepID=UPI0039E54E0A
MTAIYLNAHDNALPKPNSLSISKYETEIRAELSKQINAAKKQKSELKAQIKIASKAQQVMKVAGLQFLLQSTVNKEKRFADELTKNSFINAKATRLEIAAVHPILPFVT